VQASPMVEQQLKELTRSDQTALDNYKQQQLGGIGHGRTDRDESQVAADRMSPLFDWIVIDSAPAIAVHDASVLADLCDGALFAVRAGSTDFEVAQRAAGEFRSESLLGQRQ
jgi:Mrp family chromosome partitioning ATPase